MRISMTLSAVLLLAATACDPPVDPGPVETIILPVEPNGTIAGLVRDVLTGLPLDGVTVTVLQTGDTATTDATGGFSVGAPSSAGVALTYTKEGYFDAFDTVNVPSSAGNLAQENGVGFSGPIGMLAQSADPAPVPVRVLDDEGGPLPDAAVRATLGARFFVDGSPRGEIIASVADAPDLGEYLLESLPDLVALSSIAAGTSLTISVAPPVGQDLAPVVRAETLGSYLAATPLEVTLAPRTEAALRLVDTNVPELFGDPQQVPASVNAGDPVTLTFSRAIDPAGVSADAIDEEGQPVTVTAAQPSPEVIELTVDVPDGAEVLLNVRAEAEADDDVFTASAFFFTAPPNNTVSVVPGPYLLGDVNPACPDVAQPDIILRLDGPIGARNLAGEPVTNPALERARVVIEDLAEAADAGRFALTSVDPVFATVEEIPDDGRVSGFTTRVRIPWPGIPNESPTGQVDTTYQLTLVFNEGNGTPVIDSLGNTLGSINGDLILTTFCP
jgi:hypothetical protein